MFWTMARPLVVVHGSGETRIFTISGGWQTEEEFGRVQTNLSRQAEFVPCYLEQRARLEWTPVHTATYTETDFRKWLADVFIVLTTVGDLKCFDRCPCCAHELREIASRIEAARVDCPVDATPELLTDVERTLIDDVISWAIERSPRELRKLVQRDVTGFLLSFNSANTIALRSEFLLYRVLRGSVSQGGYLQEIGYKRQQNILNAEQKQEFGRLERQELQGRTIVFLVCFGAACVFGKLFPGVPMFGLFGPLLVLLVFSILHSLSYSMV